MKKTFIKTASVLILAAGLFTVCNEGLKALKHRTAADIVPESPQQLLIERKEGIAPNSQAFVYVTKVVDGDTIEATYKGETQRVRLLCIDTPESVKQGVDSQTFSKEASEYTKKRVLNKSVKLVFEKGLRDRYGRLLAHVFLKEGGYLNAMLVVNGYARVEFVSPNTTYKDYFLKLQEEAERSRKGFWSLPESKQPFIKDQHGELVPAYKLKEAS